MRVVVFSEVKWSYMRTRKRFLIERFPEDWRVLFLEPANRLAASHWRPVRDGRVTVATLPLLKPSTTVPVLNRLLARRWFRGWAHVLVWLWARLLLWWWGRQHPRVVLIANVLAAPVATRLGADLVVYDCNDDPLGFGTTPGWVAGYLDHTLRVADLVVSCSRALVARLQARHHRVVHMIGNGVEYEHFARDIDPARVDTRLRSLPRPRIGYAGAIADWFDFELVGVVATTFPEVPVVLMGPIAPGVAARARALAAARSNVLFTGTIPYERLPDHLGLLDVCLIPFQRGELTDVLNPNKLYEYLAAGRGVVTLDYSSDVDDFADWVSIASDERDFVRRVGEILRAPPDPERQRRVAKTQSWGTRATVLVALLEEGLAGRFGGRARPGEAR